MNLKISKGSILMSRIRFIYLAIYITVVSLTYSIQVSKLELPFIGSLFTVLGVVGIIILCVDFFYRQILFTPRYSGILVLFVVAVIASSIVNIRYGFMANIKTIAWSCIQMFLMASIDVTLSPKLHKKHLKVIMDLFGIVWFVWVVLSLIQFINQTHEGVYLPEFDNYKVLGFLGGRLHGVFKDPNYAALCSIAAIVFAGVNIVISKRSPVQVVLSVVQIVVQACYIILSGSRTSQLALLTTAVLAAILISWCIAEKYIRNVGLRVCSSFVGIVLVVALLILSFNTAKTALAYLPEVCNVTNESVLHNGSTESSLTQDKGQTNIGQQNKGPVSLERPDVESSDISNNRFEIWIDYLQIYKSVPVFGTSPTNSLAYITEHFPNSYIAATHYSVHNGYLAVLVYTGLVGAVIVFVWLLAVIFEVAGYLIRRRNSRNENYYIVFLLSCFLVCCAISAVPLHFIFFSNSVYDVLFWIVLGYVRGFVSMDEPQRNGKMPLIYRAMRCFRIGRTNGDQDKLKDI